MYPQHSKKPIRWVCIPVFFLFVILSLTANAQRNTPGINGDGDMLGGSSYNSGGIIRQDGWSIALNGGYESPLGELKDVYKGAPTFGITVNRRVGNVVYSGTVDYRSYKPKQAEFLYNYYDQAFLTAVYSNYRGIGGYLGIAYEVPISGLLDVYVGVNGGFMLTSFSMDASDDEGYVGLSSSSSSSTSYIGPKLGFNCAVSSNFSIGIEGRYSLGFSGASYNSREGGSVTSSFHSYAGNLFLVFNF